MPKDLKLIHDAGDVKVYASSRAVSVNPPTLQPVYVVYGKHEGPVLLTYQEFEVLFNAVLKHFTALYSDIDKENPDGR